MLNEHLSRIKEKGIEEGKKLLWTSVIPSFLEIKESAECGIVTKRIKACYFHFL